jgi:hypothetical protein
LYTIVPKNTNSLYDYHWCKMFENLLKKEPFYSVREHFVQA